MIGDMNMHPISQRIMTLLKERGETRADLARRTAIPYHRLTPWFTRENAKPNGPDIERVAAALDVSVSFLVYGTGPNPVSARDWISTVYQQLEPEKKRQLEGFVQFLLSQPDSPDK